MDGGVGSVRVAGAIEEAGDVFEAEFDAVKFESEEVLEGRLGGLHDGFARLGVALSWD